MRQGRGLITALAAAAALALAGCGEKDEPETVADDADPAAREAAVEWAELLVSDPEAACEEATEYGRATMFSWTSYFNCGRVEDGIEEVPRALLVDDLGVIADGLEGAPVEDATSFGGTQVQRFTVDVGDGGTVAVDVADEGGTWRFAGAQAAVDPLAGPGSEAIDEAAIEGLDQTDPEAVLVRAVELVAASDPSACLLFTPATAYGYVRGGLGESCAEVVAAGTLADNPGFHSPEQLARGAQVAELDEEKPDPADPSETRRGYTAEVNDGTRLSFTLVSSGDNWQLASIGAAGRVEVIKPGEPITGE